MSYRDPEHETYPPVGQRLRAFRDHTYGPYGAVCVVGFEEKGRERLVACDIQWRPVTLGERVPLLAALSDAAAQQLMDSLWDAGIRPAGAAGSAGQLSAVEKHLNDMRALVRSYSGAVLP